MKLIPKYETGKPIIGLLPPKKVTTYDRNDARSYTNNLTNNIQSAISKERTQGHQIRHGDFYYNSKSGQRTGSAPQGLIPESPEFDILTLGRAVATSLGKASIKREIVPDEYSIPDRPIYDPSQLPNDKQIISNYYHSPEYSSRFQAAIRNSPNSSLHINDKYALQDAVDRNLSNVEIRKVPDQVLADKHALASSSSDGYIEIPTYKQIPNTTMVHELEHQSTLNGNMLPSSIAKYNESIMPKANIRWNYISDPEYQSDLLYLSDPEEFRTKAFITQQWANKNNIPYEKIPSMYIKDIPSDAKQIFANFQHPGVVDYLNKFLMLTGAAGIANKKGEP